MKYNCPRCNGELYLCNRRHGGEDIPEYHCNFSASHNFKVREIEGSTYMDDSDE